jgi:hypothetical protein
MWGRDPDRVQVPAGWNGVRGADLVLRRPGGDQEDAVHQLEPAHLLVDGFLREVEPDLGPVALESGPAVVIVDLHHDASARRQEHPHAIGIHDGPRPGCPPAEAAGGQKARAAEAGVAQTRLGRVEGDRGAGGIEIGQDVMDDRPIPRHELHRR